MFVHGIESGVAITAVLLLIGVPTNAAVVWIHTRKDSRVAKNKFPLIFAAIDLIAIVTVLPLGIFYGIQSPTQAQIAVKDLYNSLLLFLLNGYWAALLSATVDKFYAVFFPFKYRLKRPLFVKMAVVTAFGVNLIVVALARILKYLESLDATLLFQWWFTLVYSFLHFVIFLTTIVLFACIVAKLIHNGRKLRTVGAATSGCV